MNLLYNDTIFETLFECSPDACLLIENNRFIKCNKAAVAILHADSKEQIFNTHPSKISPEIQPDGRDSFEKAEELLATVMHTGSLHFEWTHKRMDGEDFPVEVSLTLIKEGERVIVYTVWRDISERKRAEAKAREKETLIYLLLQSTAQGVYGTDINGICTFCNPACLQMLGYESADQLLGKKIHTIIHHTKSDGSSYSVDECMAFSAYRLNKEVHIDDELFWRSDGSSFNVEYWSRPILDNGEIKGTVVAFVDITARNEIAEKSRKREIQLQLLIKQIAEVHTKKGEDCLLSDVFDGDLGLLRDAFNDVFTRMDVQNKVVTLMQLEMQQQKVFAEGVLNKAAVPIFVLDTNHRIVAWNNAMENLTGLNAADMLGSNRQWLPFYECERPVLADLILSADESNLEKLYDTYSMSQHVLGGLQSEGWFDHIGGQRRYLLFDAAPVFDAMDVKLGVIETLLDITDRKLAEDEQRKLARAVSENPCSIVITDPNGSIEYVNRKFYEVTGYTTDEIIGQNPRLLKSGEMTSENYEELWREISHGRTWRGEFHNRRKDGELYWEIASISPVLGEDGQITHYLAVKEDITQRKLNEVELAASKLALQDQHKQLNLVFSNMEKAKREWEDTLDCISDVVLMCDTFGKIKRGNRSITELTGLPFEKITGKNWMSLLIEFGFNVVDFDGHHGSLFDPESQRSFEVNVSPIKQHGSPLQSGTVISIHDTTALKTINSKLEQAYTELQQTQSQVMQQEKMASIGQLAAGVAHEINNPMGFISSNLSSLGKYMEKISTFTAALLELAQTKGDPETVSLLNELRRKMKIDFILGDISGLLAESQDGAERVRRIVQDLKSFSHVDDVQCKPFSVNECLASTLNMARNEIKYIADVELDYDPDLPLLNCYPQQLNQVFMNILVNAAHAIEGQGLIKIKTRLEANDIVIRISDNGKGIAPENLTRIFEPFFTTKDVGKGTGLGLSISYDIIKKHNGVMEVESEVGVGTTFIIRLPVNRQLAEVEGGAK